MNTNPLIEFDDRIFTSVARQNYIEALWIAEEQLHLSNEYFGAAHPETAKVLNNPGWIQEMMGHTREAEYYYNRAVRTMKKHLSLNHPDVQFVIQGLNEIYSNLGIRSRIS